MDWGIEHDRVYKAHRERSKFWYLIGVVAFAIGLGTVILADSAYKPPQKVPTAYYVVLWLAWGVAVVCPLAAARMRIHARAGYYERQEAEAIKEADDAVQEISLTSDPVSFLRANQRQLEAYASIARTQAETSHRTAQAAMAAAGLLLLGGGIAVFLADDPATKISAATLAAIGTTLSGFISRTFIDAQRRAVDEMAFYFRQPLTQSYILTVERIASQLKDDGRDNVLTRLSETILKNLFLVANNMASSRGRSQPASRLKSRQRTADATATSETDLNPEPFRTLGGHHESDPLAS
jgi:hypothetical protein